MVLSLDYITIFSPLNCIYTIQALLFLYNLSISILKHLLTNVKNWQSLDRAEERASNTGYQQEIYQELATAAEGKQS